MRAEPWIQQIYTKVDLAAPAALTPVELTRLLIGAP
jgi:hypothetical protein